MRELAFAIPGDLAAPTGGYEYARRLIEHLPAAGIAMRTVALDGSFPGPNAAALHDTATAFAVLPPGLPLLVDGLAYGAIPPSVIREAGQRPLLALVHHPLGYEAGLPPDRSAALVASEIAALALADIVVTTSPFTARLVANEFGVDPDRIRVARPGTSSAKRVPQARRTEATLLAVGAVTPRKGYDKLLQALAHLRDRSWRLTIVGALDRDPAHARALRAGLHDHGLAARVEFAGAASPPELDRLYAGSDALVSASMFEGYGMALAEGLARGLPIVMSRGGASDETVPDAAALKVEPGDVGSLADALRKFLDDPDLRTDLAEASWSAGQALPRWSDTAAIVAAAVAEATKVRH